MSESKGNIILYNTPDGKASVALYAKDGTVWMNQNQLAELFDTSKQNISQHIRNILEDNELSENSVVKNYFTTASDGKTASEIVISRADALQPNMNLTTWLGSVVRKQDIFVAKNYLKHDEVDTLNRLVVLFLESAELRARNRQDITMEFWRDNVDKILEFQDKKVLQSTGSISKAEMEKQVRRIYELFDQQRKIEEAKEADAEDLESLKKLADKIKKEK